MCGTFVHQTVAGLGWMGISELAHQPCLRAVSVARLCCLYQFLTEQEKQAINLLIMCI